MYSYILTQVKSDNSVPRRYLRGLGRTVGFFARFIIQALLFLLGLVFMPIMIPWHLGAPGDDDILCKAEASWGTPYAMGLGIGVILWAAAPIIVALFIFIDPGLLRFFWALLS